MMYQEYQKITNNALLRAKSWHLKFTNINNVPIYYIKNVFRMTNASPSNFVKFQLLVGKLWEIYFICYGKPFVFSCFLLHAMIQKVISLVVNSKYDTPLQL